MKRGPTGLLTKQVVREEKLFEARRQRKEQTPAGQELWQHLRANQLHGWHFRRQQVIAGFIVDSYCHLAGLVVEIDGSSNDEKSGNDQERTEILESVRLAVIRFTNEDVLSRIEKGWRRSTRKH